MQVEAHTKIQSMINKPTLETKFLEVNTILALRMKKPACVMSGG